MKTKTTIILIILSLIIGSVAGFFGSCLFMNRNITILNTANAGVTIVYLHSALRSADAGNLVETQKLLERYLKFSLSTLNFESDFSDCPSVEKYIQKTKQYLKERNKIAEQAPAGDSYLAPEE